MFYCARIYYYGMLHSEPSEIRARILQEFPTTARLRADQHTAFRPDIINGNLDLKQGPNEGGFVNHNQRLHTEFP